MLGFKEASAAWWSGHVAEAQASVAEAAFSPLLDGVGRGQTIVIPRHGRPVARIVPDEEARKDRKRGRCWRTLIEFDQEIRVRNAPIIDRRDHLIDPRGP